MEESSNALEIKDLHYYYQSNWMLGKFHALKGVNLEVRQGEFFGFLGHNGGGKTTTIKCILRLIKPTSGTIQVLGESNERTDVRQAIGYVPEQPYFYDHLTVRELVEMYAHLAGVERAKIRSSVDNALNLLNLGGRSKAPMRTLSKGLTQRVAMAQAIVASPRLLLLDEPFSGLDPLGRKEFKDLLFIFKSVGTTIFISSHIISDIEFLCDRASILVNGELKGIYDLKNSPELTSGTYELTLRDYAAIEKDLEKLASNVSTHDKLLKLKFNDRKVAEEALCRAIGSEAQVEAFHYVHANLEDIFVELAGRGDTNDV